MGYGGNKQAAEAIGRVVAERAQEAGVKKSVLTGENFGITAEWRR